MRGIFSNPFIVVLTCCLLWLTAVPGCGRKTMPVPPQAAVPVAISDLKYSLREDKAVLTWSYPRKLASGKNLFAIDAFMLWRAVVREDGYCEGCPLPFMAIAVAGGALPGDGRGRTASYEDTDLRPGYRYFYKVQASADGGIFGPDSNVVEFTWK